MHEHYAQLLSSALDGALSPDQLRELEAHLAQCPACRALQADLLTMEKAFAQLPDPPLPEGLHEQILTALAQEQERASEKVLPFPGHTSTSRKTPLRKWFATAAAAAVVLLSAWGLSQPSRELSTLDAGQSSLEDTAGEDTTLASTAGELQPQMQSLPESGEVSRTAVPDRSAEEPSSGGGITGESSAPFCPVEGKSVDVVEQAPSVAESVLNTSSSSSPFLTALNWAAEEVYGTDRSEIDRSYRELTCTITLSDGNGGEFSGTFTYLPQTEGSALMNFYGQTGVGSPLVERQLEVPQTLVK